jgi:peptidoglycan-N-acetylglucosamine deacetylase
MNSFRCFRVLLCFSLLLPALSPAGIKRVKTDRNVVALTFDDGPNPPYTEKLLHVLTEKKVKATFFLIGKQIDLHPETARQIIKAGHELGGHSSDWETLAFKRRTYVEDQLAQMERAFSNVGVTNLTLFRPPGGILSPGQDKILKERGLVHISADVVVGDWKEPDASTIRDRVVNKVRSGSIIVLHDGGGDRSSTISAVPQIIDGLRECGYSCATVSELLELK